MFLGVPAPLLCEILKEESTSDDKHVPEMVCHVIDSYLVELANKDELTVDTFKNMVQAVPAEYRSTHDGLFQILEQLLNSGITHTVAYIDYNLYFKY